MDFKPESPPTLLFDDGSLYFGDADPINRVPHGVGLMIFQCQLQQSAGFSAQAIKNSSVTKGFCNGDRYCGHWCDGVFSGEGTFISAQCVYEGPWSGGKPHGKGTMKYGKSYNHEGDALGSVSRTVFRTILSPFEDAGHKPQEYCGDFHREFHRHGEGVMRYYNGDCYEGTWSMNCRSGYGKYTASNGEEYCGLWLNDERHGKGLQRYADGSVFNGVIEHNKRHGQGTFRLANGDKYSGEFVEDRMEGTGVMRYKNGDVYEGKWRDGKRHGEGRYTLQRTGAIMTGRFDRGFIDGCGMVEYPGVSLFAGEFSRGLRSRGSMYWMDGADGEYRDKLCYQGEWKGEQIHGRGLMWFKDGSFYYGMFAQNKREGEGNIRLTDGAEYSGEFRCNEYHGRGILQLPDGSIRAGLWEDGRLVEGYEGQWNGSELHGIGNLSISALRLLSRPTSSWKSSSYCVDFYGVFKNGRREGPGVLKLPIADGGPWERVLNKQESGSGTRKPSGPQCHILKGEWRANMLNCDRGVWAYPTGEVYIGRFSNNYMEDPQGRLWLADGSFYMGGWHFSAPCGKGVLIARSMSDPVYEAAGDQPRSSDTESTQEVSSGRVEFLMGLFGSPSAKDPGQPLIQRRIIDFGYHYILLSSWEQSDWSLKKYVSHVAPSIMSGCRFPALRSQSSYQCAVEKVHTWKDGTEDTECVAAVSFGDTEEFSRSLKPPTTVSVGAVNGDGLVVFPSGIQMLCCFTANQIELFFPHSPLSPFDAYVRHLPAALTVFPHPSQSAPSQCSNHTTETAGQSFPVWEQWKPFMLPAANAEPSQTSHIQCSICSTEFRFFRRAVDCPLCLRSICASCLQSITSKEDLLALCSAKSRLSQRGTEGSAESVETLQVCPDCAKSVSDKVTATILWIPLEIISSMVEPSEPWKKDPGDTFHQRDQDLATNANRDVSFSESRGCADEQSTQRYVTYMGYSSRGKPHVFGEMWWQSTGYYIGSFKYGERSGLGYQVLPNGDIFCGVFQQDAWNGNGTYFFSQGYIVQGTFLNGQLDHLAYHGEVNANLQYHGLGVSYEPNGSIYNGEWNEGKKHGEGYLQFIDGALFAGTFVNNSINGVGKLVTKTSAYYGTFKDGKKDGKAVEFFSDCAVEGTWVDNAAEGYCRIFDKGRSIYETTYVRGVEQDDCFSLPRSAPNDGAVECDSCHKAFYLLLRRHHCRLCCHTFCDSCTRRRSVFPKHFNTSLPQRVCDRCFQRLQQRRSVARRQYSSGEVYVGCWSRGRWVSRGLLVRPDGLFVVMDELGVPLHEDAELLKAREGDERSTECCDASPPLAVFQSATITHSSPLDCLDDFIDWFEKMKSDCHLSVSLELPLIVQNFMRYRKDFKDSGVETISLGSPEILRLTENCLPAAVAAYPSPPPFTQPPYFCTKSISPVPHSQQFTLFEQLIHSARNPPRPPTVSSCFPQKESATDVFKSVPDVMRYDIGDEEMKARVLQCRETLTVPPLVADTPPIPAYGSPEQVAWDAWSTKPLPVFSGAQHDAAGDTVREMSDAAMYYAIPFWRGSIVDAQRVVELGKIRKGCEMIDRSDGSQLEVPSSLCMSDGWIPSPLSGPLGVSALQVVSYAYQ